MLLGWAITAAVLSSGRPKAKHSGGHDFSHAAHCEKPVSYSPSIDEKAPLTGEHACAAEDEDAYSSRDSFSSHQEYISAAKDDDAFSSQLHAVVMARQIEDMAAANKRALSGSQCGWYGNRADNMSSNSNAASFKGDSPWRESLELVETVCRGGAQLEKKVPCISIYYLGRKRHDAGPVELSLDLSKTEDRPCRVLDYGDVTKRWYPWDDNYGFRIFRLDHESNIGAVAVAEVSMSWLIFEGLRIDEGGVIIAAAFAKNLMLSHCEILGPVKILGSDFGDVVIEDCTFRGGLHVWNSTIGNFSVTGSRFEEKELALSHSCVVEWLKIEESEMDADPVIISCSIPFRSVNYKAKSPSTRSATESLDQRPHSSASYSEKSS